MSDHKCVGCNGAATRIKERADLGAPRDRIAVCDGKDCQPDADGSRWHTFNLDGTAVEAPKEKPR